MQQTNTDCLQAKIEVLQTLSNALQDKSEALQPIVFNLQDRKLVLILCLLMVELLINKNPLKKTSLRDM